MAAELRNLEYIGGTKEVNIGDLLIIAAKVDHRGDAFEGTFYAAIGIAGIFWFDEILAESRPLSIAASSIWQTVYMSVLLRIENIDPGTYSLYAKIDSLLSPIYEDVIIIGGAVGPAVFSDLMVSYAKV